MSTATDLQRLKDVTRGRLEAKCLSDAASYKKRLSEEWKEIYAQDEAGYFLDLYDRGVKFPVNQNNLLTPWLLGVVDDFDIDRDPECVYGEYPDIDVDYVKEVRDYLKNVWGPKTFGADKVCNIGNYSTFGIKMAFLDMAVVYGENRAEINALTKKLGIKDEDGKALTFDKALELYPELKAYADKYPHIAKAVKKMLHRKRGMGKHAGGLIIADCNISDFVPLVKNAKDDTVSSAWPEGLQRQDLGPVGLIKFDMLVVSDLERRNCIARFVKKRHGLAGISAKPETPDWDWSDGAYRHDPKALAVANAGDLLGIFQFDSDGIRKLARDGGVRTFRDIVAYSALYRPGPLNMEMEQRYIERSHGREKYSVHPILEPYLGYTYGVMCVHQNALISMSDGREIPIKDVRAGDAIHALDEQNNEFVSRRVEWAGPTKKGTGLFFRLENGVSTIVTPDHSVLTARGWVQAQDLDAATDLVAIPRRLPSNPSSSSFASWLGSDEDVAYLMGMLVGDGCMTSSSVCICSGRKASHDILFKNIKDRFPALAVGEYFHCRAWYISLAGIEMSNDPKHGNRKTKFSVLMDEMDMRHASRVRHVPDHILRGTSAVRAAFLAGLFDADGTLNMRPEGTLCAITSTSDLVINGVRKILLLEGIYSHIGLVRIHIWNTAAFASLINPYVVLKIVGGKLSHGPREGWVPRSWLREALSQSGLPQREFSATYGIDRQNFKSGRTAFVRRSVVEKAFASGKSDDVLYLRIAESYLVENQQFYDLSVSEHHNFIADGIVVHNCFQEQVMQMLNHAGGIPLKDCYAVVKAIAKKKLEGFAKYKEQFLLMAQGRLGISEDQVRHLWGQIESFAEYGFNKSLGENSLVESSAGAKAIKEFVAGDVVYTVNPNGDTVRATVLALHDHGDLEGYEVTFDNGSRVTCSRDHKFLTPEGQMPLWKITESLLPVFADPRFEGRPGTLSGFAPRQTGARLVPATEGHAGIADSVSLASRRIVGVVSVGKRRMYDLEVGSDTHNFILAGGVVTSNSHSCAYSYLSSQLLYMKANYPAEFWAGTLSVETDSPTIDLYRRQADKNGIKVNGIHMNRSGESFSICPEDDQIYMGFVNIKGVGVEPARRIVEARGDKPFGGIEDFLCRFGTDATVLRALIGLRLFKEADPITLMKFVEHFKDVTTKRKQRQQRFANSVENFQQKLLTLLPERLHKHAKFQEAFFKKWEQVFDLDEEIDVEVEETYDTGETQEVEEKVYRPKNLKSLFDEEICESADGDSLEEVTVKKTVAVTGVRTVTKKKKFNRWKELKKLWQMQQRSLSQYGERNVTEVATPVTLSGFNPTDIELKPEAVRMLRSRKECELEYLGFEWLTAMEQSPDYDPKKTMTYDHAEILASQKERAMYLQGQVEEVQLRKSKAKNSTYHSLVLTDAMGRRGYINVWNGEWEKFKGELKKGNLVRVLVRPPSNGFSSYSVWGPPRNQPWMASKHGIVQVAVLDKHQDDVLPEDDFERQMSELTGDPDDQCGT